MGRFRLDNAVSMLRSCSEYSACLRSAQQSCKRKIVFAILRFVASCKSILCSPEQPQRDQRLLGALVLDALPDEPANVEPIFEHHFQIGAGNSHTRFAQNGLSQGGERMLAGRVNLEDSFEHRRTLRINLDAARSGIVLVSEWSMAWINALFGLFAHPLLHFLAQILGIVLGYRDVDVVHELVLRARVLRNHPPLFDQMNFDTAPLDQLLKRDAVGAVSIKAVGLLDQHRPAMWIGLQQTQ